MIYLRLFWEFFKTGLFSVGGGLATLPFIYDMSDRTGWFTYQQIADMVAVSESTPGPIGVNTATYVGYITGGVPGALVATLGLVTPAVICILIVASCLKKFRENRFVDHAFYGLRPASAGLIAAAGFSVVRISLLQESTFRASGRFTICFSGRAAARSRHLGADECRQADEKAAPDRVHRGVRRGRHRVLVCRGVSSKKVRQNPHTQCGDRSVQQAPAVCRALLMSVPASTAAV